MANLVRSCVVCCCVRAQVSAYLARASSCISFSVCTLAVVPGVVWSSGVLPVISVMGGSGSS